MIEFGSAQVNAWLAAFLWPYARVLGLLLADPVYGHAALPLRVKAGLALVLTVAVAPVLPAMPVIPPASPVGLLVLAQQLLIGAAMGLVVRIVLVAVELAGDFIGLQMGLGFATFFDPDSSAAAPLLGQFTRLLALLTVFAVNGHLFILQTLAESFTTLPVAARPTAGAAWLEVARWGAEVFRAGLWLSLPVVAALLVANLAIAVMTRAAPQLNVFAVGFPVTLAVGFVALSLALIHFLPQFQSLLEGGFVEVGRVLELGRGG